VTLIAALREMHVLGVITNKALLLRLLDHHEFARGDVDTAFVDHAMADRDGSHVARRDHQLLFAAALLHDHSARLHAPHPDLRHFRSGGRIATPIKLQHGDTVHEARVTANGSGANATLTVDLGHVRSVIRVASVIGDRAQLICDDITSTAAFVIDGDRIEIDLGDGSVELWDRTLPDAARASGAASGEVNAPMDGVVIRVEVTEQAEVTAGQALLTIESMKLQHVIRATIGGRVELVATRAGAQVKRGVTLVRIV
jgi:acetyl/propionyl-CoA carboxylase alpha subunit